MHPNTLSGVTGPDHSPHSMHASLVSPSLAHSSTPAAPTYQAPHSVYHPPAINPMQNPYNPYESSPGSGVHRGAYNGYGGYGAASAVGTPQLSPSSAVYNPNYNYHAAPSKPPPTSGYPSTLHAPAAAPAAAAMAQPVPPPHHAHYHGGKNFPPSAPPGY
jgi:hypothetical protein